MAAATMAAGVPLFGGSALGLLEELGEDACEGDDEAEEDQGDGGGAPEADVAGGAGDLGDVGEGEPKGDEGEDADAGGEDVEVASHGARNQFSLRSLVVRLAGRDPTPSPFDGCKILISLGSVAKILNSGELRGKYCIQGS
jgi:hypothetical protein